MSSPLPLQYRYSNPAPRSQMMKGAISTYHTSTIQSDSQRVVHSVCSGIKSSDSSVYSFISDTSSQTERYPISPHCIMYCDENFHCQRLCPTTSQNLHNLPPQPTSTTYLHNPGPQPRALSPAAAAVPSRLLLALLVFRSPASTSPWLSSACWPRFGPRRRVCAP